MQRVKSILMCLICGALLLTSCALPNRNSDPSPVAAETARTVLPDRYPEGNPSPDLKDVHEEVVRHIKDNPGDFGGAYIDFAYEAVNVWTAEENAWSEAEFAALRNELDPKGELIRHVGNGKSLSYLEDLRADLVSKYKPGESSKISEIYVDPVHNGCGH